MSSTTGPQTNSGNLIAFGFRFEVLNLFASILLHPLNWYAPSLAYTKFSWALTLGPITITQVDYNKYMKTLVAEQKSAAKELTKILEKLEEVNGSAKDKLKDLTSIDRKKDK